jgi:D-3-phosphoglycerate dehydrogenase / 2-oxoglutarate reductase
VLNAECPAAGLGERSDMIDQREDRERVVVTLGSVDNVVKVRVGEIAKVIELSSGDLTEYQGRLADVVGIVARGLSVIDVKLMDSLPGLQVIARSGVGVDRVDVAGATDRGIAVVVTPNSGSRPVAEGTIALVLNLVKRLGPLNDLVKSGQWTERERNLPGDVDGATLGVIGFGRIGRRVSEIARVLGMDIVVHDPFMDFSATEGLDVEVVRIDDLIGRSDVITIHAPLTDHTQGMIGTEFLGGIKPGLVLVNSARGGLLDLDAAYAALCRDDGLSGLGLDVYDPEPPDVSHPLFSHPNVVFTPHVLGLSRNGWRNTFEDVATGVIAVLSGERPPAVANPELYPS